MKFLKKFIAGAAVGSALLGASQPASATLSLIFFDEFFNEVAKFTAAPGSDNVSIQGTFFGWSLNAVGALTFAPDGTTRLSMSGTNAVYKNQQGSTNPGCSASVGVGSFWSDGVNVNLLNNSVFAGYQSACSAAGGPTNHILRIYAEETSFPAAPAGANLNYSLTSARNSAPDGTVGGSITALSVAAGDANFGSNGFKQTFNPVSLYNATSINQVVNIPPIISPNLYLQAGIDLIPSATAIANGAQSNVGGFQWNLDVVSQVPEPGTLALLGLSLVGIGVVRRRGVKKSA